MKRFVEERPIVLNEVKEGDYLLHGDVILFIEKIKENDLTKAATNHLALGEATGHSHTVFGEEFEVKENSYAKFLFAISTVALKHQEHRPIVLPPGTTARIGIQREYDPFSKLIRRVAD